MTPRTPPTQSRQLARVDPGKSGQIIPIAPGLTPDAESLGRMALAAMGEGRIDAMDLDTQRRFLIRMAQTLGLNPVTNPFLIIAFEGGKKTLYLTKGGAEQLAGVHRVSTEVVRRWTEFGLLMTLVRAQQGERFADATGAVPFETADGNPLPLQSRPRVVKICETQARRRAILGLLGLGFLDRPMPEPTGGDAMIDRHGNLATRPPPRALPTSTTSNQDIWGEDEDEPGLTTAQVVAVRPEDVAAATTDEQAGAVSPSGEASAAAAAQAPTFTSTAPAEPDPDDEWEKTKRQPPRETPAGPRWGDTPLGREVSQVADQLTSANLKFALPADDASDADLRGWLASKRGLLKQRS